MICNKWNWHSWTVQMLIFLFYCDNISLAVHLVFYLFIFIIVNIIIKVIGIVLQEPQTTTTPTTNYNIWKWACTNATATAAATRTTQKKNTKTKTKNFFKSCSMLGFIFRYPHTVKQKSLLTLTSWMCLWFLFTRCSHQERGHHEPSSGCTRCNIYYIPGEEWAQFSTLQ